MRMAALGIGERLRNTREARGLTLQAVEGLTHIRAVYLQALEDEQFNRLPGPVYAKGFLRAYAAVLGLEPERLLEAYPADLQFPVQPIIGTTAAEVPIRPTVARSRVRRIAAIAGTLVLAGVLAIGVFAYLQVRQFAEPIPPQPVALPAPPPAPRPQPAPPGSPTQVTPEVTAAPTPTPLRAVPAGRVAVEVRATDTSWLRVSADGERVFQGFVRAGDTRIWRAQGRLTIRVGNAPVVQVLVNGRPVQPRARGRVWEQTFTAPPAP